MRLYYYPIMGNLFFKSVEAAPADAIFQLTTLFEADPRPHKVNLSVGLYRDDALKTPILKTVKIAEAKLLASENSKEYLPIEGNPLFIESVGTLVFGDLFWQAESRRICGLQSPGGTGALYLGSAFFHQQGVERIAISEPTWPNHRKIFTDCNLQVVTYPYYHVGDHQIEFEKMCRFFEKLPPGSIVLLQPSCHNPTGADLTWDQWKMVQILFRRKRLLPFFDFAYQGLGSGIERDAGVIRLFAEEGMEMAVACSQSKNFGLYSERVGALFIVTQEQQAAEAVLSKVKTIVRTHYSNPPRHGAAIVAQILSNPSLKMEWEFEVQRMRERIEKLRSYFVIALASQSPSRDFHFLAQRKGMFCFTGLERAQVERLQHDDGIYMTYDGRLNIAGLSQENLDFVVSSILRVISAEDRG